MFGLAMVLLLPGCLMDFSPDGRQIVVAGAQGLSIGSVDGTGFQPIPGSENGRFSRWAPDGKHILFDAGAGAQTETKLYDVAARKTISLGGNLGPPFGWREDGRRCAYIHDLGNGRSEAVWYNLNEGGITLRVALPFEPDPERSMVWLPNTDDIALAGKDGNVYTVEAGEVHKITTSNDAIGLALGPSGKRLVWARKSVNLRYILMSVFAFDVNQRNVARLPFPVRVAGLNPDPHHAPLSIDGVEFSPNGTRLALLATFASPKTKSHPTAGTYQALYTVRMNGADARLVQRAADSGSSGGTDRLSARWSRDGSQLAVLYVHQKVEKLFITAPDGTSPRLVQSAPAQ